MIRIGLLCMVFLGCASPFGRIDSYEAAQFDEPLKLDESPGRLSVLVEKSFEVASSIKPGMSIGLADKILLENGFYLVDRKDTASKWDREYRNDLIVQGPTGTRIIARIKNKLDVVKRCEIAIRHVTKGMWLGEEFKFGSNK